jgi:hypothetical protein
MTGRVAASGRKPPVTRLKGLAGVVGDREYKREIIRVLHFQYACCEGVILYNSVMYKEYAIPDFVLW